jgi:hypothetical protein
MASYVKLGPGGQVGEYVALISGMGLSRAVINLHDATTPPCADGCRL